MHGRIRKNLGRAVVVAAALCATGLLIAAAPPENSLENGKRNDNRAKGARLKDAELPKGYRIMVLADGLNFPTAIAFGENGAMYVSEAGGIADTDARIVQIDNDGSMDVVAENFEAPITDITFHEGWIYVSQKGKITRIRPDGTAREDVVTDLPALGDHSNADIVFGPGGRMFFAVGSATNSGVVGTDNTSWLMDNPTFHDIPCADVQLHGTNFTTPNPLMPDSTAQATTGAYLPFGQAAIEGETITGETKCTGSILVANADGSNLGGYAWGFRNPFGLAFDAEGQLWATNNGMDERGSRPVEGDPDAFFQIAEGHWYGWPDFSVGRPVNSEEFAVDGVVPQLLLAQHPELSPFATAFAKFEEHVSANKFDFSTSDNFAFKGDAFVAETGSIPAVNEEDELVGYRVTRVNMETGEVTVFLSNKSTQPAFISGERGINKPIDVKFSPENPDLMFVVDFGAFLPSPGTEQEFPNVVEAGSGAVYLVVKGKIPNEFRKPDRDDEDDEEDDDVEDDAASKASPLGVHSAIIDAASGQVKVSFDLAHETALSVRVYDTTGRLVRTLVNGALPAGKNEAAWDGLDEQGQQMPSGVYLYRIENGETTRSGKVTLLRR